MGKSSTPRQNATERFGFVEPMIKGISGIPGYRMASTFMFDPGTAHFAEGGRRLADIPSSWKELPAPLPRAKNGQN